MIKKRQIVARKDGSSGRTSRVSIVRRGKYLECQMNHAANLGSYAVDGCREFMASGEEGSSGELICAACGCHRNIHREEEEGEVLNVEGSSGRTSRVSIVRSVKYFECQKNHAANSGSYGVDGCREFMASGEEGSSGELICAACACHRNFHRKEEEGEVVTESSSPSSNDFL